MQSIVVNIANNILSEFTVYHTIHGKVFVNLDVLVNVVSLTTENV